MFNYNEIFILKYFADIVDNSLNLENYAFIHNQPRQKERCHCIGKAFVLNAYYINKRLIIVYILLDN